MILKLEEKKEQNFSMFKTLKAHVLPLTNCCFNKNGDKYQFRYLDLSLGATIGHVRYGILKQATSSINLKGTRMQYTLWRSTYLMGRLSET